MLTATNSIRCITCRGLKELAGIGGIMKTCWVCDGKGRIEKVIEQLEPSVVTTSEVTSAPVGETLAKPKRKSKTKIKDEEVETADMFIAEAKISEAIDSGPKEALSNFMPEIDEFTKAILDEVRMDPIGWQLKYKHIPRLFGINPMTQKFDELVSKVQRAAIRANYAINQPKIARTVNLNKMQDGTVEADSDYLAFKSKEKAAEAITDGN